MRSRQIAGPYAAGKPVTAIVRLGDDLGLLVERGGAEHRPEYFLLYHRHRCRRIREQGRRIEIPGPSQVGTAPRKPRALRLATLDVAVHGAAMLGADERPYLRRRIEPGADTQRARGSCQRFEERGV